jgi:hypothetical protein
MRISYDLLDADAQSTALHTFACMVKKAIGELPEHKYLSLCKLFLSGILLTSLGNAKANRLCDPAGSIGFVFAEHKYPDLFCNRAEQIP